MKIPSFLFCTFFFLASSVYAETITITLQTAEEKPIAKANVYICPADMGFWSDEEMQSFQTDEQGTVRVDSVGRESVLILDAEGSIVHIYHYRKFGNALRFGDNIV